MAQRTNFYTSEDVNVLNNLLLEEIEYDLQRGGETLLNKELDRNKELVYSRTRAGETLLHFVARNGTLKFAQRLIQLGSDVNAKDHKGKTPLWGAIGWKTEMVQFLLNNGTEIEIDDKNYYSFLGEALMTGSFETVCLLVSHSYGECLNLAHDETKENQCRKIVKCILPQVANLKFRNTNYPSLLHFTLMHGDDQTFKLVLHKQLKLNFFNNLKINAPGPHGTTILHNALCENKKACIKHLVDFGIDINTGDAYNRSVLHYAVRKKDPELVRFVLNLGADANQKTNKSGYTPLHVAVALESREMIDMLLNCGADITAKCESGRTMGPRCLKNHRASVLNFVCGRSVLRSQLSSPEINYSDEFNITIDNKRNTVKMVFNKELIKFLLEKGAETEVFDFSCNENSATPLHRACETGRLDVTQLLLDNGADIYAKDSCERNVLHYAVIGNNFQIVDLLLQKGFAINSRDKYLLTPLYYFVKENEILINGGYKDVCRISMLDFLVDNGAEVNVHCGTQLDTPLHSAGSIESPHLIETLLALNTDFKEVNNKNKYGHEPFTHKSFSKNCDFSDFSNITESGKVLIAYRALTEDNFYSIDDCNIKFINNFFNSKAWNLANLFFENCKSEVQKMKKSNIYHENNVTFYNFLTSVLGKASKFARSKNIMQVLESGEYKKEFPLYAFLMEKRIERVVDILYIEDYFTEFIQEYAKMKLAVVVLDEILSYLSIGDIRNFGRALSLLKKENCAVVCRR